MAPPTRTPKEAVTELAVALARCPQQRHSHKVLLEMTPEVADQLNVFLMEYHGEDTW